MHHQHRNLAGLVGLEHVQPAQFFGLIGIEQAGRRRVKIAQLLLIQGKGQGRRQVALQRHAAAIDRHVRRIQRVVQLDMHDVLAGGALVRQHAQKRRDGEAEPGRIELFLGGRLVVMLANRDQRHAQPVIVILVLQAADVVVGNEAEAFEILGPPAVAAQHDRGFHGLIGQSHR